MLLVQKAAPGGQGIASAARLCPGSSGRLLRSAKPHQEMHAQTHTLQSKKILKSAKIHLIITHIFSPFLKSSPILLLMTQLYMLLE